MGMYGKTSLILHMEHLHEYIREGMFDLDDMSTSRSTLDTLEGIKWARDVMNMKESEFKDLVDTMYKERMRWKMVAIPNVKSRGIYPGPEAFKLVFIDRDKKYTFYWSQPEKKVKFSYVPKVDWHTDYCYTPKTKAQKNWFETKLQGVQALALQSQ